MCKCCNLFSPNQSELLSHVSEKHRDAGVTVDDIIIPLRPLSIPEAPNPSGTGDEFSVMKRKRGRPKGSTKKSSAEEDLAENTTSPNGDGQLAPEEGSSLTPSSLECSKCCRKFSNTRQLRKHICIIVLNLGEEEGEPGNESDLEVEKKYKEDDREKAPKRPRSQKTEKVQKISGKEAQQLSGVKKPIISVVLTAHEAIPGATKIIPVEAGPPEVGAANPESAAPDLVLRRGYQEYAIQQTPYEQPMKSSRLGPTQLKIFTCEYCNKVFKFKHSLQAHLRIHTNEKPYKCPQCSYASAIKANLNVHLRKHTGEKFSCDYCSFTCLSKGHLKVHIERVHKKIKQHCRFCKKKYSDVKNLIKHIRDTHDPQDKKVKEALDELRLMTREGKRQLLYDCHICERKFKNELDRDRHMLVHGDKWPYACELCGHGATKYQALELHVRKHPFVYVCAICLKKFVSSIRLRSHIKEVHGAAQEALVFTSSINQSFCLLEPGGDIQQEALGGQLQLVEEEFVCQGVDALKEGAGPKGAPCEAERKDLEVPVKMPAPEVPLASPQAESDALPPCELETTVVSADLHSLAVVSDDFLLKNDTSSTEAHAAAEKTLGTQHGGSAQTQGEEIILLLSKTKSAGPSPETQSAESPPGEGQEMTVLSTSNPNPSTCLRPNPVEAVDLLPPVASVGDTDVLQPDSCKPASEHQPGSTAFMKVLDSLQKKQMNTGLCERIRKVYGDLECEYCGKLFWYQVHFDMHVRTHTREHLYYCSQCHYSSITKNCLKRHVIQKHSNILLKCPTDGCDYSTPDKYKLQAHLKVHTELDKRSYSCPVCEKSFSEDRLIKSHIKTNHPEVSMSTISEVLGRRVQLKGLIGKRAMKCPYCDFYFMKNGSDLQRHIWAHEGVKPFKCSLCEYATRSKSNLKAHMNRHSTEKTHLCDMCGKKFKSKGTLKSHKLLHTADGKQFKCTVCDYTAAQKPQLLRHMEQHASFKPFRCAHCHYSCNISGSLKRHYNRKHPSEEYANVGSVELAAEALIQQGGLKCPVCSFVYGTKWEFNRHLKNKHGLKVVEIDGDPKWEPAAETPEEPSTQYLHITEAEEDVQGTQAAVAALQDLRYTSESGDRLDPTAVNILQQIIELGTETHDATAVASVVAMAPGTVTVVKQVTEEEPSSNHTVMIQETLQQASVELAEQHHLVVSSDDVEGIETVTVYTQGGEASEFIVYVQEAMQPMEEQAGEQPAQEL
ncbi:zinc finger protein ZFAT isoform X1 [Fukomys damarensis]|uniref:Zinc finger protein ZFAT n=2 Tax=Fukomys damarensis TaxID=885580 RepID=A0A091DIS3_FUKDA|nr:zinc finger protein ZFAT isoform X1 [Fukomys damarensis]XP_010627908.1 zinc finger protein ZFAT isoform X1 [Fukomys damarensis]XP_010627910.1 zinc finger protein ZFAT isoform X1 [Fukomys damarensis]XP_010627911.1 zinc finger protein ZFAT isoform X1 [Fukomys damarensis]XP_010627912.1 zinc finger protein ZFAT isoform X1 [Fukomys damarensis]XP_033616750.1 zinc finger protein ZFAT isoform X1 [Fukomys damarensis]KFO30982.1 Zinc finger protein ZFAT [Fukomys damarensis]